MNQVKNQPAPPKASPLVKSLKKYNWMYFFVFLTLAWYIVFCYVPMGGVVMAFKRFTGVKSIWESKWVGFKWFRSFFESYYFKDVMLNTIRISVYTLLTFPIPVILALMLNEVGNGKIKSAMQTIMYAPHFISTVVLVCILNLFFSTRGGFVNSIISLLGGEPMEFITNSAAFPHMYVWSGVWQNMGWNCIIYVAALSGIDQSMHEAAILDGATRMQRIFHINLPSILPTIMITLILQVGQIMTVSTDKVLLMQNDLNLTTSEVVGTFVYTRGLVSGEYSYAAAVGLFLNVINLILLLSVNKISEKTTDNSLF